MRRGSGKDHMNELRSVRQWIRVCLKDSLFIDEKAKGCLDQNP